MGKLMESAGDSSSGSLDARQRWLSLAEVIFGGLIVVGHNVYHKIPNEVPILFVLGLISIWLREGGWRHIGLRWPQSWWKALLLAIAAAALLQIGGQVLVNPITARIWHRAPGISTVFTDLKFNVKEALKALALIWTFAAFGEEVGYRGYLLNRAADVGNRTRYAYAAGLFVSSVLFGYGHYYKGPAGILQSSYSGLALGAAYLLARRNLWVPILAHGISDTFVVVVLFFGWAS